MTGITAKRNSVSVPKTAVSCGQAHLAVFRRIIKSGSNPSAAIPETVIIGDRGPSSQAANNPHTTASQAITLFNNPQFSATMTPEASAPIYPTPNATPLTIEATFCDKAKREILRFGVENALTRWRVICDYMQTEDWWPPVARKVEKVFDDAFEERNKQLQKERERQQSQVSISVSQQQTHEEQKTDNTFASGSNSQVFNGAVSGDFKKTS